MYKTMYMNDLGELENWRNNYIYENGETPFITAKFDRDEGCYVVTVRDMW